MFIDGYKQLDVVEDCKIFLNKIKNLKPYIIEFNKDGTIKPKIYPWNCTVEGNNWQPIIMITHNECIFFANNKIKKV